MTPFRISTGNSVANYRLSPLAAVLHAVVAGAALASASLASLPALAQSGVSPESVKKRFDIPPGDLGPALSLAAAYAGLQLSFDAALTRGKTTLGVSGDFTAEEVFGLLLDVSGLELSASGGNTYVLRPAMPRGDAQLMPAVKVEAAADRLFDPPPEQGGFKADYQDSATKTPLSLKETPQSVSVITRESMDARQVRDINSALELAAGVAPSRNGGGPFSGSGVAGGERFVVRGQQLSNDRDVRIDGFAGSSFDSQVDPILFERVEYIKGPSSALYGTGSLSGFINRVSKKPQAERRASVAASYGSFDTYRTELDVTGALDADQRYTARLVGVYDDSGSVIDETDRQVGLIAPSFSARLGEHTRVLAQTYYQDVKGTPQVGLPLLLLPDGKLKLPSRIPRDQYPGVVAGSRMNSAEHYASLRVDHEWSDRWLSTLLLQQGRNEFRSQNNAYAFGIDTDGNTTLYSGVTASENESWAGELRVEGRIELLGREHRVLLGAESRHNDRDRGYSYAFAGTGNLYTGEFDADPQPQDGPLTSNERARSRAAFAQVVLSLAERTRLIAGLRREQAERRNRQNVGLTDDMGMSIEQRQETDKVATTWRVGLSQDLTPQISAFAAYATSFSPVLSVGPSGAPLRPEQGKGLELGLKGEWFDGRFGTNVAVFRQKRDKVPLGLTREECQAGDAGLTVCSRSAGVQEFEGIEIEASGQPLPGLTLGLAASWLDGEFTQRSDPDTFGRKAIDIVTRQTNLYVDYEVQAGTLRGLGLGATLVSLGDQGVNRVGQFAAGYERVDLHLHYAGLPHWDFRLLVRNLLDARYIERPNGAEGLNFEGAPRAALLRAEYRFDL